MDSVFLTVADIASIAHEANRQYQRVTMEPVISPPWNDLDEEMKRSIIEGVRNILRNPALTPEESHESWLAFKREHGWSYGPIKDPENKLHPCMRPYSELPAADRLKDHLFGAVVRTLLVGV